MTKKEKDYFMETVNETAYWFNHMNKSGNKNLDDGKREYNAKFVMLYDIAPHLNCAFDFYRDENFNIIKIEFNDRQYLY